jgi:mannose-6-phosphate isomerase-like protein (cupin superfamily)
MPERVAALWDDVTLAHFERKGAERTVVHASNFSVEWVRGSAGQAFTFASDDEIILLFPGVGGALEGQGSHAVPSGSVAIAPAGSHRVTLAEDGAFAILATHRADLPAPGPARNPLTRGLDRTAAAGMHGVRIYGFEDIEAPADNRRMRFLRSATMSINIVEYDGPRDRTLLSPHSHVDFEQATLTVAGAFTHHLRVEWSRDANRWRDDLHLQVENATFVVIPPGVTHTTEGVGEGRHLLFDIFAPPRADFIAKGWVHNAESYAADRQTAPTLSR